MNIQIIKLLSLKEVEGLNFGHSLKDGAKTYLFGEDVYCSLTGTDGFYAEDGMILFWRKENAEPGYLKLSEEFILDSPSTAIYFLTNRLPVGCSLTIQ